MPKANVKSLFFLGRAFKDLYFKRNIRNLFQKQWYRDVYGLRGPRWLLLLHYLLIGASKGYDPNPLFDTDWYLDRYPEVAAEVLNPLDHFQRWGSQQGRMPSPLFNTRFYRSQYKHIMNEDEDVLSHYFRVGRNRDYSPNKLMLMQSVENFSPIEKFEVRVSNATVNDQTDKRVTIYIPVHGQWLWTERCIQSLMRTEAVNIANIVVIDDKSPDNTVTNLRRYPFVRVLAAPTNMGFTRICNFGAFDCDTEFLLLLNNDTEPLEGFLTSLIESLDSDSHRAIVGSRLVFPDGSLQEAGGIIWSDGSGHNFGRGEYPDQPEFLIPREVDFCSGASILIRTDFFKDVGGFDEIYAPAYYEDVDLAFNARNKGLSVCYEPNSVVVHHEGGSHGTDVNTGIKKHQVINQDKFVRKWHSQLTLKSDPSQTSPWIASTSRYRNGQIILFLDHDFITPKQDAGSLRAAKILEMCQSLGFDVAFGVEHNRSNTESAHDLRRLGIMTLNGKSAIEHFIGKCPGVISCVISPRAEVARRWLLWIQSVLPDVPFVFDTVDMNHVREELQADILQSPSLKVKSRDTKRRELFTVLESDITVVVSDDERQYLLSLIPSSDIQVIPTIHDIRNSPYELLNRKGLLFVGSFKHPPNEDGLLWFFNEVWPLIDTNIKSDGITIIGADPPSSLTCYASEDVVFTGWVDKVEPFLDRARLSIAPLRFGAGVKGKIGDSWASGVPVVGTSLAFNGMAPSSSGALLAASTASDFANLINQIYFDEQKINETRHAAFEIIEKTFSSTMTMKQVENLLLRVQSLNETLKGRVR